MALYSRYLIQLGRNREMEATKAYEAPIYTEAPVVDVHDFDEEMNRDKKVAENGCLLTYIEDEQRLHILGEFSCKAYFFSSSNNFCRYFSL